MEIPRVVEKKALRTNKQQIVAYLMCLYTIGRASATLNDGKNPWQKEKVEEKIMAAEHTTMD